MTHQSHRADAPIVDKRNKGYQFQIGDLVSLYENKPRKGRRAKLNHRRWTGPRRIVKKCRELVYTIVKCECGASRTVNVDGLMPYPTRQVNQFSVRHRDEPFPAEEQRELVLTV